MAASWLLGTRSATLVPHGLVSDHVGASCAPSATNESMLTWHSLFPSSFSSSSSSSLVGSFVRGRASFVAVTSQEGCGGLFEDRRLGWAAAVGGGHVLPRRLGGPLSGKGTSRPGTSSTTCMAGSGSEEKPSSAERTFVMVKPDGVQRGLVGDIIGRFEQKGFTLKGLKLFQCPQELAQAHYKDLASKPFYSKLVSYIVSGPVVCMIWEGKGVVASARKLIGVTNPLEAEPGTIRGDFAVEVGRNVVHGSDSPANGEREIGLWFQDSEIADWEQTLMPWLRE